MCSCIFLPWRGRVYPHSMKVSKEAAGLDERGHPYTQGPRAREDKDHGNCAPREAERWCNVSAGIQTLGVSLGAPRKRRRG
jgi:hypothetical protein